jgi:hypothetical protein
MGDLFAAQFVCVGFNSLPGGGAPHGMGGLELWDGALVKHGQINACGGEVK